MPDMKRISWALAALLASCASGVLLYRCGSHSRDDEVRSLNAVIAHSETTIELKKGLYETKLVELGDLRSLLDKGDERNRELLAQLSESRSKILSTQVLSVRLKAPLQSSVSATQSEVKTERSDRRRVDFKHDFGSLSVSGFTLTDPPEGFVSLTQTKPLRLGVNVIRNPNGSWSSLVSSDDPNVDVSVNLGAVDLGVIPKPSWYQRIWVDAGATFVGDRSISLGSSYRGDRISFGLTCFDSSLSKGCGITGGFRIF